MVQMEICGLNSKLLTKNNIEKPDLVLKPRRGQEIQKQYMLLYDS